MTPESPYRYEMRIFWSPDDQVCDRGSEFARVHGARTRSAATSAERSAHDYHPSGNEMMTVIALVSAKLEHAGQLRVSRLSKLLARVLDPAAEQSIVFGELVSLLLRMGFEARRSGGSHVILHRQGIPDILNVQPRADGTAKPYQVRQVRRLILNYGLHLTLDR